MPDILVRENAPDLAYVKTQGSNKDLPAVIFLGGFRSDMEGTKAIFLEELCKKNSQTYVRFDYRGHGQSQGVFEEACISDWAQDARDVIEHCTSGPVILVGSSMGGWISLLIAIKLKRVEGLIGLAAAPDFTLWMEEKMDEDQKFSLKEKGYFELPNDYDPAPYIITKTLIEDGRKNKLLDSEVNIDAPVRLIQGMKDADVEWQTAHRIKNAINGENVEVILLENADHRLSAPEELKILENTLNDMLGV